MTLVPEYVESLTEKVWDGHRIEPSEALLLYKLPLPLLGKLAHHRRQLAHMNTYGGLGNQIVTYVVDRNINYTNICQVRCRFCAFWRSENAPDAYVLTLDELDRKIEETVALGGTQILLQGGHHPSLPLEWYLKLLQHIRERWPQINVHGFSPPEIIHFSKLYGLPIDRLLVLLKEAGLGSIPGGGAEILVDRVRREISPAKATAKEWLEVMEVAHSLGIRSTATMMFGHIETLEERIEHLDQLRRLQDKTGGFTAFIAWTFQSPNTRLQLPMVGAVDYLRTLAISRIYLDNFANIQASWVTQGPHIGQLSLLYGANDMGSTMIEENVVSKAGACYRMSIEQMEWLIREAGFYPVQRDTWYRPVKLPAELLTLQNDVRPTALTSMEL